jgi:hypothetical protein
MSNSLQFTRRRNKAINEPLPALLVAPVVSGRERDTEDKGAVESPASGSGRGKITCQKCGKEGRAGMNTHIRYCRGDVRGN